jgi:hypothetical protein
MKLDYPYETAGAEKGATVVPHPNLPGCSSFFNTGIEHALANLAKVRRLWIDGLSKANLLRTY